LIFSVLYIFKMYKGPGVSVT